MLASIDGSSLNENATNLTTYTQNRFPDSVSFSCENRSKGPRAAKPAF
jgi:hypothetical protein